MAEIELGPLTDRLSDDEIADLSRHMERLGAPQLPRGDEKEATTLDSVDDDVLGELLERLEAHDAAAEIYLPVEFDGSVEVGKMRIGSAPLLIDVLEELKDELDLDAEDDDEDEEDHDEDEDEDDEDRPSESNLKQAWKVLYESAQAAVDRKLPMHVKG
jgi:hypothetical protein